MNEEDIHLEWAMLKIKLDAGGKVPSVSEGEVWWCSCGKNICREINGKSALFSRPVLIYKKFDRYSFLGIPLTSQYKTGSWYVNFVFANRRQTAVLSQARTFSVSRLHTKMGELSKIDFAKVKKGFLELFG